MRKYMFVVVLAVLITGPSFSHALQAGDVAPGFEAPSTHGNVILSEFEGKKNVVLALYYADFSPV